MDWSDTFGVAVIGKVLSTHHLHIPGEQGAVIAHFTDEKTDVELFLTLSLR